MRRDRRERRRRRRGGGKKKTRARRRRRPLVGRKFSVMKISTPVGLRKERHVTNFPAFSRRSSGRCGATSSCTGRQIRNQRRRTLRKEKRGSSLRSTLRDVHPSWAGTSGLRLRIHIYALTSCEIRCSSLCQDKANEKERRQIGRSVGIWKRAESRRTLRCNVLLQEFLLADFDSS